MRQSGIKVLVTRPSWHDQNKEIIKKLKSEESFYSRAKTKGTALC